MFWDPFFRLYFPGMCFRFRFWASHWFCTSSFSFYRYHMHCRGSVWDEGFYIAFFGGFYGWQFSRVFAQWVFGDLILIYAGSNFLDSGMSVSCFLHSLQGVWELQLVVRVIFHLPDGMPLWLGSLGRRCSATLFGVWSRIRFRDHILTADAFVFLLLSLFFPFLQSFLSFHISDVFCNCSWADFHVGSRRYLLLIVYQLYPLFTPQNLISHLRIYFLLYDQTPDFFK